MEEEQPKDYVTPTYEEWVKAEYIASPFWIKITYQLQKHIVLTLSSSFVLGYLAGAYLGRFW